MDTEIEDNSLLEDEDNVELYEDFECEIPEYKGKTLFSKRNKIIASVSLILCCLVVCVVVFGISIGLGIYFGLSTNEPTPDSPNYYSRSDVLDTVEFQIALNPKKDWIHRDDMVDRWIESMNEYNPLLNLTRESAVEDVYLEYHILGTTEKRCSLPEEGLGIRYRNYQYHPKISIDIKGEEDERDSCDSPYWPAEEYYDQSRQKCEEDAHPCFDKYTRASSISFNDTSLIFPYCTNLTQLFPDAFPTINDENAMNIMSKTGDTFWWKYQWKGDVGEHTSYEITFTIDYISMDKAMSGVANIVEGEWSLRCYSNNGDKWEEDTTKIFEDMFYQLVLDYDVYEDHVDCANAYFDGTNNGIEWF